MPKIPQNTIDKIRDLADIVDVINEAIVRIMASNIKLV